MKKVYYSIGEVCRLLDLKPHILRYWETEFPQLSPHKTRGGTRRYSLEDIETLKRIQNMLHEQKFTIEGARKRLKDTTKQKTQLEFDFPNPKAEAKAAIIAELKELRSFLLDVLSE
jgi:DNA-binding transcriptional MerR regulator